MHVKDLLDDLNLRLELPQHWYSTDIGDEFEEPTLVENGEIIKIEAQSADKKKVIVIDVDDGMSSDEPPQQEEPMPQMENRIIKEITDELINGRKPAKRKEKYRTNKKVTNHSPFVFDGI
jgi:hypothetical protein